MSFHPFQRLALASAIALACAGCGSLTGDWGTQTKVEGKMKVTITRTNYHGWPDCILMQGGGTEAVIVPAIGRLMQFHFIGEPPVFWENRALDGQLHPPQATNWVNFGGDKSWPAPESDWPKPAGGWLPPAAFDSMPVAATIERDQVILTSPIDPDYGIRVVRRIQLGPAAGVMTVSTRYEKITGAERKLGIWVITQLAEPQGLFCHVPLIDPLTDGTRRVGSAPDPDLFRNGFRLLNRTPPPDLKVSPDADGRRGLVSLTRNPKAAHKIGLASGHLLWVGEHAMLKIDSTRYTWLEYPDGGCNGEIYTNPDPLPYIELETLGARSTLKQGATAEQFITYTLRRRTRSSPEEEARAMFGL